MEISGPALAAPLGREAIQVDAVGMVADAVGMVAEAVVMVVEVVVMVAAAAVDGDMEYLIKPFVAE